jgi:hypothetical protein
MDTLDHLLVQLADEVAPRVQAAGLSVAVTAAELDIPIETVPDRRGALHASLPRGRMVTGFMPAMGRLRAVLGPVADNVAEDAP